MSYDKTIWHSKDIITREKMQKIEDQLELLSNSSSDTSEISVDWNDITNKPAINKSGTNNKGIIESGASSAVDYAHAEGGSTVASGNTSHAEGGSTTASGSCSHAEGGSTVASGNTSHAEGGSTTASGSCSHAEGANTAASGNNSHAEGAGTKALSDQAHAEGGGTTASGVNSHTEGGGTTASGESSHAEGGGTTAFGNYSHAEGASTIANRKSQHVFGEFNIIDDQGIDTSIRGAYVEIVGNGTSTSNRKNARTLDWSGNESLAGSLTLGKGTADEVTVTAAQLKALLALLNVN